MDNIEKVLAHAKSSIVSAGGDPEREAMTLIYTKDGKKYYRFGDKYYRVYIFIDKTLSLNLARNENDFYESGVGFGKFARLLNGFDAGEIHDVIPDFHNTRVRYDNFVKALEADKYGRASECAEEIKFVTDRREVCGRLVDMLASGTAQKPRYSQRYQAQQRFVGRKNRQSRGGYRPRYGHERQRLL